VHSKRQLRLPWALLLQLPVVRWPQHHLKVSAAHHQQLHLRQHKPLPKLQQPAAPLPLTQATAAVEGSAAVSHDVCNVSLWHTKPAHCKSCCCGWYTVVLLRVCHCTLQGGHNCATCDEHVCIKFNKQHNCALSATWQPPDVHLPACLCVSSCAFNPCMPACACTDVAHVSQQLPLPDAGRCPCARLSMSPEHRGAPPYHDPVGHP
jgi:hypothetical protein